MGRRQRLLNLQDFRQYPIGLWPATLIFARFAAFQGTRIGHDTGRLPGQRPDAHHATSAELRLRLRI